MPDHAREIAGNFYSILRDEVIEGNPRLSPAEQRSLQGHYGLMMATKDQPSLVIGEVYIGRRAEPVREILRSKVPVVFDAGCGYGSESYLFASLGAQVIAVDRSENQIEIARKRMKYFEERLEKELRITFLVADLNTYQPSTDNLSLTWVASVLAAMPDQDDFLRRVYAATRPGGAVMITDMNLGNPLFLVNEWRRRRNNMRRSRAFRYEADYAGMLSRTKRSGARYFPTEEGPIVDDVQFFTAGTLGRLLQKQGFHVLKPHWFGFLPPRANRHTRLILERVFSKLPAIRAMGYFYLLAGIKA